MNAALRILKFVLILVGALVVLAVGGIWLLGVAGEHKWGWIEVLVHYRFSFEVEVAGVAYTGSTVVQVTYTRVPSWEAMTMPSDRAIYQGQAAVLKIEDGKMICLMPGARHLIYGKAFQSVSWIADRLLTAEGAGTRGWKERVRIGVDTAARASGSAEIPLELLPPMIVIGDPAEPRSAHIFDPEHPEHTLGPGARFLGAQIAVTNEPATIGIENDLTWLRGPSVAVDLTQANDPFNQEDHGWSLLSSSFY